MADITLQLTHDEVEEVLDALEAEIECWALDAAPPELKSVRRKLQDARFVAATTDAYAMYTDEQIMEIGRRAIEANRLSYTTGTGQRLGNTHSPDKCEGESCVIHNPSDHAMSDFPTHWRGDRGIMERICPHGVGHPDPDDLAFIKRTRGVKAMVTESVHGCDGCCHEAYDRAED